MKRKFIIIDPGLVRLGGHNYTLAVSFSDAAHALGYDVLWFCHETFPTALVPDHVRADAVFSLSTTRSPGCAGSGSGCTTG